MTASAPDSPSATRPRHVRVCGNDHSPWVQAVLLGLHDQGIDHTLELAPPADVFVRSGVLMPVARLDDGAWMVDSERILIALGYREIDAADRRALQSLFLRSSLRRADDGWAFWHRFSFVRDGADRVTTRCWHQFWRAFAIFYFFVLIRSARRRISPRSGERVGAELDAWQQRLGPGADFFGGEAPSVVDLQLFGLVQMAASIPGPMFEALRLDPKLDRLRTWISAMQQRFADYDHLYTAQAFEPRQPAMAPAGAAERCAYWAGAATMWLAFPITVPLVFYFVSHIRRAGMLREDAPQ